jgi:predicted Zn-ribbon and HTH transcriptional regulator
MAHTALLKAKETVCRKCGFHSKKAGLFGDNKCPECHSNDLLFGRDKVVKFDIKNSPNDNCQSCKTIC